MLMTHNTTRRPLNSCTALQGEYENEELRVCLEFVILANAMDCWPVFIPHVQITVSRHCSNGVTEWNCKNDNCSQTGFSGVVT